MNNSPELCWTRGREPDNPLDRSAATEVAPSRTSLRADVLGQRLRGQAGEQSLHGGRKRMDAALGMRMQHRTARRRQVVRVYRHPRRLRVMGGDGLSERDLDRQVVSHQRGSHLGQRQQVLSRGEHRDRAVPSVGMQVGKQQGLAAPQPPAADDLLGEPRGDDLNAVGTERATGHGSHHPLGHVVRRGREQVQRRQQPAPLTGQRIPPLLHPQRHRPEISGRVQDLHRH